MISSPTWLARPHASMTKASFTATQAMRSIPLSRRLSAFTTKPGRCALEQVGVNAPGTEKSATRLPAKSVSVFTFSGPFSPMRPSSTLGILSPTLIVIACSFSSELLEKPCTGVRHLLLTSFVEIDQHALAQGTGLAGEDDALFDLVGLQTIVDAEVDLAFHE